jgi:hypothetical protein
VRGRRNGAFRLCEPIHITLLLTSVPSNANYRLRRSLLEMAMLGLLWAQFWAQFRYSEVFQGVPDGTRNARKPL